MSDLFLDLLARSGSTIEVADGVLTGPALVKAGRAQAESWAEAGLRPGDRVGLWLANGRHYLEGLSACAAGGYVAVSVNTRWSPVEAEVLLNRSGARWLRSADGDRPVAAGAGADPMAPFADGDRAFVVFTTSGTTSRPKMVVHGQRSIVVHGHDAATGFGYCVDDVGPGPIMVVMPLCGVFGLASFTAAVAADAKIVMPSTIDPITIARRVERDRVRAMNGSDDLFHRMLDAGDGVYDLSSLHMCGYARFNTSLDGIVERAERRGMILTGLYGMSEVQALYSVRDPHGDASKRRRAGGTVVSDQARARVIDGELQLRGPSLFAGYLAEGGATIDAGLTAAAFTDGTADDRGWFCTGDAAEMQNPVGGRDTFVYQARLGDVLRLGGFLVAPAEIEAAVIDVPGVDAAQVVAVDRPTGARPVAFVTGPCSADPSFDEQAAIDHCAARLARFKVPIRILPIDEFPTTPSANGTKIQKAKLRAQAVSTLADGA